jgi:hypothetical protein
MHEKVLALIAMIEDGNLDIEKAKMLLESIMEQLEVEGDEDAIALTRTAHGKLHEWRDKDSGLMDAMESLGRYFIDQDRIPIEKFLVQRHEKQGFRLEDIQRYREDGTMVVYQSLLFKIFVWLKTPDKMINEVCFLDENKQPKVINFKGLVDSNADEESQFKTIREELRDMGI